MGQKIDNKLHLVFSVAKRMRLPPWYSYEEAVSIGYLGLRKGINAYRKDKGMQYDVYIRKRIYCEIKNEIAKLRVIRKREPSVDFYERGWV